MGNWQSMLFSANGRIRRSQYWLWAIGASIVIGIIMQVAMMVLGVQQAMMTTGQIPATFWIVYLVVLIPAFWIGINLQIKRWHDRDKSGWWALICLIPIIGGLWVLIECGFLDGTQGPNKFGPSPKGIS
ncbi:MAG TPA: DUF805 domain-containing protein [Asticcacaulis sp.]|nr:DUF805 domain-containing protein [Asticcacaulis sp.]